MRFRRAALIALAGLPLFGATHTTTAPGLWSDTGIWDVAAVPGAGDLCIISHPVIFDDPVTGADDCGRIEVKADGSIIGQPGLTTAVLQVGGMGASTNGGLIIEGSGVVSMEAGQTIRMNPDDGDGFAYDPIHVQTNGILNVNGQKLADGVITAPPTDTSDTSLDIESEDIRITDETASFPTFPAGSIVYFLDGNGADWQFEVLSNTATTIDLDYDSLGNAETSVELHQPATAYATEGAFRTPRGGDRFRVYYPVVIESSDDCMANGDAKSYRFLVSTAGILRAEYFSIKCFQVLDLSGGTASQLAHLKWGSLGPGCAENGSQSQMVALGLLGGQTLERIYLHDSLDAAADECPGGYCEGDTELCVGGANDGLDCSGSTNRCHGILMNDGGTGDASLFSHIHIARMNDDGILLEGNALDSANLTIEDSVIHDIPKFRSGTSADGIELDTCEDCTIRRNRIYNIEDKLVNLPTGSSKPHLGVAILDNVLVNSADGSAIEVASGVGANLDISNISAVNNFVGFVEDSCLQLNLGFANYVQSCNQGASNNHGTFRTPTKARGNVIIGDDAASVNFSFNNNDDPPDALDVTSNIIVGGNNANIKINATVDTQFDTLAVEHNLFDCQENDVNSPSGSEYGVQDERPDTSAMVATYRSNLFFRCATGIKTSAVTTTPIVNDYNVYSNVETCVSGSGRTTDPNGECFGRFPYGGLSYGAYAVSDGMMINGHDGDDVGIVWAGINASRLPIPIVLPAIVNVVGANDVDGDGIIDRSGWDNCPGTAYNPSQRDTDGDGIGDACE